MRLFKQRANDAKFKIMHSANDTQSKVMHSAQFYKIQVQSKNYAKYKLCKVQNHRTEYKIDGEKWPDSSFDQSVIDNDQSKRC